jgi:phosphoribosyl-AMP cyclohydrolase
MTMPFAAAGARAETEAGTAFTPRFDRDGLIPCIVSDAASGEVVMFAHMNAEALARTVESGVAHYWSRSRGRLWRKGEESGHTQRVVEMRIDCDQDALWLLVETAATGANCHTGRKSCFYRRVPLGAAPGPTLALVFTEDAPRFDPGEVYGTRSGG